MTSPEAPHLWVSRVEDHHFIDGDDHLDELTAAAPQEMQRVGKGRGMNACIGCSLLQLLYVDTYALGMEITIMAWGLP